MRAMDELGKPCGFTHPVYYLGGYSGSQRHRKGTLSLISEPEAKLVFESYSLKLVIPAPKIQKAQIDAAIGTNRDATILFGLPALFAETIEKVLTISYEDKGGSIQKPRFQFIAENEEEHDTLPEKALANINSLILQTANIHQRVETRSADELTSIFCKQCGAKNDADAKWCGSCGKKLEAGELTEIACPACGTKSKIEAVFCKQCGAKLPKKS